MPAIDRTITVEGDLQRIWDYLPQRSKLLGEETEVIYRVVGHEAPHRLELDGDAGSVQLHDTIEIEQDGGQVRVRYRARFHPQGAAKLVEPLLPLGLKKLGDDATEQLEECLRKL